MRIWKRLGAALMALATLSSTSLAAPAPAPQFSGYSEAALHAFLAKNATVQSKLLVPMRDGIGLSTDIYLPKDAEGPLPAIFWRTPYDYNTVNGSLLQLAVQAIDHGYAFVIQNERGRYFSEGKYQILGYPQTDGYDALTWISQQAWSNHKVGTLGCSSSAEWQLALAAQKHPALAAMVAMSAGAGIGRVGPFEEQGNWYTGGVPRTLFFVWLYGVDNPLRANIPAGLDPAMRARIGTYNDLAALKPKVDWTKRIKHLPLSDMLTGLGEPPGTYEQFIARKPNDPAWFQGGLYHDNEGWNVPALWFNAWYDVSIGPNMALFNHAREADPSSQASQNQYAVIAPVPHCQYFNLGPDTVVGERNMGDTSFDTYGAIFSWFDRWLKAEPAAFPATTPHVRYYMMGENKWRQAAQWPPADAKPLRLYLHSQGGANSLYGDGKLSTAPPTAKERDDRFVYDPLNPVQTIGGGDCCNGGLVTAGAFDQRLVEARQDVLVYTTEPLTAPIDVAGGVKPVLFVSSDAKDTDFAVKLVDVAPDGTAYIIGDTILRARYRDGLDHEVMMQPGETYRLSPTPMTTAIRFEKGHRIRVEITSSDFPKFARNLNTGGDNVTESKAVVAKNAVHHAPGAVSFLELSVLP
ncbi:MAG TPA: CocE/NonD family hydrolase [Phenylobacterium sp.]|uniref:CocE/NonD family hydrolase n=1 Tax=Phenylobacterium sp. TaxID=1871053 RepID=UPI002D4473A4|nr:CocE/NonD family hydrolase [Phenylobacterium sp.]HZZ68489.1 CocE/NonD family hydrolase [Phenylobacterium sp.]